MGTNCSHIDNNCLIVFMMSVLEKKNNLECKKLNINVTFIPNINKYIVFIVFSKQKYTIHKKVIFSRLSVTFT
jgi:hypothetical protein